MSDLKNAIRQDLIAQYKRLCKHFNSKMLSDKELNQLPTYMLDQKMDAIIEIKINKFFGKKLKEITNTGYTGKLNAAKIKRCLTYLYYEEKYVTIKEAASLFECKTIEEFEKEYKKLKGNLYLGLNELEIIK